nr:hypothetical protein [Candidatus Sigynarchaeota archaeon]
MKRARSYVELIPLTPSFPVRSRFFKSALAKLFKRRAFMPRETIESFGYSFLVNSVSSVPVNNGTEDAEIVFIHHEARLG